MISEICELSTKSSVNFRMNFWNHSFFQSMNKNFCPVYCAFSFLSWADSSNIHRPMRNVASFLGEFEPKWTSFWHYATFKEKSTNFSIVKVKFANLNYFAWKPSFTFAIVACKSNHWKIWYFVTKTVLTNFEKKIVLVIE